MSDSSPDQTLESSDDRPPAPASPSSPAGLNADAVEFVPRHHHHRHRGPAPAQAHAHALHQSPTSPPAGGPSFHGGFPEQEAPAPAADHDPGLSEEVLHKVANQVEYYFSDINLATTDHLMRFMSKDPEGFVPISVVAAFKKIKALVPSHALLVDALRTSTKLVVSEDGKKVRRQQPFTDTDLEELQSRIVVAENLPDNHSHQKLMKIFSSVGSVNSIRTCPAQPVNGAAPAASRSGKMEMFFSHKLHAFVEYETVELAEKAAVELNDETKWRSGLRVRLLLMCISKPSRGRRVHDGEGNGDEENTSAAEQTNEKQLLDDPQTQESSLEPTGEENLNEREGRRGGRGRGRGKGRGRYQHYGNRGGHPIGAAPSANHIQNEQAAMPKQPPGPRMPDGTKGFTMGRGKPLSSAAITSTTT